jgi:hypothetical protein
MREATARRVRGRDPTTPGALPHLIKDPSRDNQRRTPLPLPPQRHEIRVQHDNGIAAIGELSPVASVEEALARQALCEQHATDKHRMIRCEPQIVRRLSNAKRACRNAHRPNQRWSWMPAAIHRAMSDPHNGACLIE